MFVHIAFIVFFVIASSAFSPEAVLYLAIAHGIISLLVDIKKEKDVISPYRAQLLIWILINLGNLSLIARIHNGTNIMYFFASAENIPAATLVWCIGNCVFFAGYTAFKNASFAPIGVNFNKSMLQGLAYVLIIISLFPSAVQAIHFLPTAIVKVLKLSGLLGIVFFSRLWASENNKTYRNYTFIIFIIQITHALLYSYLRAEIMFPILAMFVGYFSGKRSLAAILSYEAIPFILVLLLFLNAFKQLGENRSNFGSTLVEIYLPTGDEDDEIDDKPENSALGQAEVDRGGLLDRSSVLAQVSQTVKITKDEGFFYGAASEPLVIAIIPRFLWPNKPKIALGQWFAIKTGTAFIDDANYANNSINMTIPGELYLDFGWIGVVLGCFFFGGFFVTLWNSVQFNESFYNFNGTVLGGYIIMLCLIGLAGDLQIVINYISFYLVFYLLKKLLCAYFV